MTVLVIRKNFYRTLCLGEVKTGRNRLQVKNGEMKTGVENNPVYSIYN